MDENLEFQASPLKFTAVRQSVPTVSYPLLGILFLFLSGCLSSSGIGTDLEGRIDRWLVEQEYGVALAAIDAVDENDARYERLQIKRGVVALQAKKFEDEVIKAGKKEVRRNDWRAVLDRYDVALKKFPQSQRLLAEHSQIMTKQKIKIHKAEKKVLFAKGEMLEKEISYNRELSQVNPRNLSIKKILTEKTNEAQRVSDELLVFVEDELERNELNKAKKMVNLAYRLHPDEEASMLKSKVLASIKKRNDQDRAALKRKQLKKERQAKQRAQKLLSEYDALLLKNKYSEAKETLVLIKNNSWKPPGLIEKEALLEKKLASHVNERLELGYSYYKRENYHKALGIWQDALKLMPNHKQAREYVERAQKVIEKLEMLQKKKAG